MPSPYSNEEYDESKPWWDQPKTWSTWYKLKPPYDNVVVGCDPRDGEAVIIDKSTPWPHKREHCEA